MDNVLEYKGYIGSIKYSAADEVFYGKIEAINALVTFEASDAKELKRAFEASVDDYLELCKEEGLVPEKTFKGIFNVRVGQELHRLAARAALANGMKLNDFVTKAIQHYAQYALHHDVELVK
jgi:predicted HicB family RNase H-like nuclease